jgi:hypothetical protein
MGVVSVVTLGTANGIDIVVTITPDTFNGSSGSFGPIRHITLSAAYNRNTHSVAGYPRPPVSADQTSRAYLSGGSVTILSGTRLLPWPIEAAALVAAGVAAYS